MSVIRRLAPKSCPRCNSEGALFVDDDRKLTCRLCGYKEGITEDDKIEKPQPPPRKNLLDRYIISYNTPNSSEISKWAEAKFYSAMDHLRAGKYDDAMKSLQAALDEDRFFTDAHIWMARLTADPAVKRNHYEEVAAQMPNNTEATRELMVLNGHLTREEADRSLDSRDAIVVDAAAPVAAKVTEIECSNCGGMLIVKSGETDVECRFCGHIEVLKRAGGTALHSLNMALLKERGKAIKWRIGKYILHCDNCSADRIITRSEMTGECPYCGSNHVIKSDALDTLRQPDGIIPFRVDEEQAIAAVHEASNSLVERFKGFFVNNRVDSMHMNPALLPYWYFDAMIQITITKQRLPNRNSRRNMYSIVAPQVTRSQLGDALYNQPVSAVKSPPRTLLKKLDSFDVSSALAYDPKRLAGTSASLYAIDFEQASLDVRDDIGANTRLRHGHDPHGDETTIVSHMVQSMTFRLVMVPVWIATIQEADGDVRLGIVHGQTGRAVLGNAVKKKV